MGAVPETTRVDANPVSVTSEPIQQIILTDGVAIGVLNTYTVHTNCVLYSLVAPIEFYCVDCCDFCETTLVAIREQWLLCPSCYSSLDASSILATPQSTAA